MQVALNIPQMERFADDELVRFCVANPDLRIERDADGNLYFDTSPTNLLNTANNSKLNAEVGIWTRKTKAGKVFDSTGWFCPTSSKRISTGLISQSLRFLFRNHYQAMMC